MSTCSQTERRRAHATSPGASGWAGAKAIRGSRERAGDEGALAADDRGTCALAQRGKHSVGERAAGLARRGQPTIARVERDADPLLAAEAVGEQRGENARRLPKTDELLLGDHAGLEQMERASRHFWAHGSPGNRQATAATGFWLFDETALIERQADDRDRGERIARPAARYEHEDAADECDDHEDERDRDGHADLPGASLPGGRATSVPFSRATSADGRSPRDRSEERAEPCRTRCAGDAPRGNGCRGRSSCCTRG